MGLKEVWGFDPEEAAKAQKLSRVETGAHNVSAEIEPEQTALIPLDAETQVYELRRMFRL